MRAGVIGVGAIGKNHARIYSEINSAELVAIYDTNKESAEIMASSYGGEVVDTIEEFISLVDVVSVATPTNTHRSIGEILLNNKKHVLIEISKMWPLASGLASAGHAKR